MKKFPPVFWWLAAVLGLPLAAFLAWWWRAWIRELVVVPLAYFLWLVGRVFESLPQPVIWGALVLGTLLVALRLLAGSVAPPPAARTTPDSGGRVSEWLRWLHLTRRGVYSRDGLARHIGDTAVAVLAYRQRCTPGEVRLQVREEALELPSPLDAYLRAALGRGTLRRETSLPTLWPWRVHRPQPEVIGEVEAMLDYLEAALEADAPGVSPQEKP